MSFLENVKSGGGSSVEGKVVEQVWTRGFPLAKGQVWVDDEDDRENTENIYWTLKIQPDGAEDGELVLKPLYAGDGRFLVIEDDGETLRAGEDGEVNEDGVPTLFDQGAVYRFIDSLAKEGFPVDSKFPDPREEKIIDMRGIVGWRLRIVNETDVEATEKFGKRKIKSGKLKGKERNREWTKVAKVFGPSEEKAGKKSAKANSKTAAKVSAKSKNVEAEDEDESPAITAKVADKFIKAVLETEGKNGSISREKLTLAVTRTLTAKKMDLNENTDLRKFVTSEEYLTDAAERGVIDFDPSAKKQTVSLA